MNSQASVLRKIRRFVRRRPRPNACANPTFGSVSNFYRAKPARKPSSRAPPSILVARAIACVSETLRSRFRSSDASRIRIHPSSELRLRKSLSSTASSSACAPAAVRLPRTPTVATCTRRPESSRPASRSSSKISRCAPSVGWSEVHRARSSPCVMSTTWSSSFRRRPSRRRTSSRRSPPCALREDRKNTIKPSRPLKRYNDDHDHDFNARLVIHLTPRVSWATALVRADHTSSHSSRATRDGLSREMA